MRRRSQYPLVHGSAELEAEEELPKPPLLVKVTGYRILNTSVIIGFGVWKSVASYRGDAILSTSLDLLLGVILATM